jgi:hypothetical protein
MGQEKEFKYFSKWIGNGIPITGTSTGFFIFEDAPQMSYCQFHFHENMLENWNFYAPELPFMHVTVSCSC